MPLPEYRIQPYVHRIDLNKIGSDLDDVNILVALLRLGFLRFSFGLR